MVNHDDYEFRVVQHPRMVPANVKSVAYLVDDNWNDFGFYTTFNLFLFDSQGEKHELGFVKICKIKDGKSAERTKLPATFQRLPKYYFSLGQSPRYYEYLGKAPQATRFIITEGLRDIVSSRRRWADIRDSKVARESLLRSIPEKTLTGQFRRLLEGAVALTPYHFSYTLPKRSTKNADGLTLEFNVEPDSMPPTNVHVLIGRNGVGKTYLLQLMAKSIVAPPASAAQSGKFQSLSEPSNNQETLFANVISVSFSAFDEFELMDNDYSESSSVRYAYIGLKKRSRSKAPSTTTKSSDTLKADFVESIKLCRRGALAERWTRALKVLEHDSIFMAAGISSLASKPSNQEEELEADELAARTFKNLSSGHKIVLLTITRLVELVTEQSLILLDEPESHLHPPLLSAFIRSLSNLLTETNGVAIIATHSPVVLQEVPKSCAWYLQRHGLNMKALRPENETFGENLGVLTREIFGYQVTESGFHGLLNTVAQQADHFEHAEMKFGGQLGAEARAILRAKCTKTDAES